MPLVEFQKELIYLPCVGCIFSKNLEQENNLRLRTREKKIKQSIPKIPQEAPCGTGLAWPTGSAHPGQWISARMWCSGQPELQGTELLKMVAFNSLLLSSLPTLLEVFSVLFLFRDITAQTMDIREKFSSMSTF